MGAVSFGAVMLTGLEDAAIGPKEAVGIGVPLANILERHMAFVDKAGRYADPLALMFASAMYANRVAGLLGFDLFALAMMNLAPRPAAGGHNPRPQTNNAAQEAAERLARKEAERAMAAYEASVVNPDQTADAAPAVDMSGVLASLSRDGA